MAGGPWYESCDSIAYILVVVYSWSQKLEHDGWSAAGVLILNMFLQLADDNIAVVILVVDPSSQKLEGVSLKAASVRRQLVCADAI